MHIAILFINIGSYHAARLRALHNACQKKGWEFTVIQVTDNTLEHPWGDLGNEIKFPLKTLLSNHKISSFKEADTILTDVLDNLKPDILVIPGWGFSISRVALSWCKSHKIPTILMSETKWDDEPRQWWKELLKFWLCIRKFDAALVGGKLHRDYLVNLGFPQNRIFFGYNAVDNGYFEKKAAVARLNPVSARLRQGKIPSKPYFIVVTRLIKRKNVHLLVEAFAAYQKQVGSEKSWDLVICGSGEEEPHIRNLIIEKQLVSSIHLTGFISYKEIGDWYGLASALIHPALQEPWGLVVNEACAAGLPILCSRTVGAASELVQENKNGWLFTPESIQEITNALLNMHYLDTDARIQMGQLSKEAVDKFNPQRFADGLISAVHMVVSINS